MDVVYKFLDNYDNIKGWRKIKNWRDELKGLMREPGKASASGGKGKEDRVKNAASKYISKSRAFYSKVERSAFFSNH